MLIGIMGAMPEEVSLFAKSIKDAEKITAHQKTFYKGCVGNHEVICVFSGWGKVAAASTATLLLSKFNADCILLAGLCGAADQAVNVGDIVVADELIQYDLDASPVFPKYEIPLYGVSRIKADPHLAKKAAFSCETLLKDNNTRKNLQKYDIDKPKVVCGLVATGDCFISDAGKLQSLKNDIPDALCVEMEGAAVAQVCYENDTPFAVIRVVSDKSDESATEKFKLFISQIAGHYICQIINCFLEHL